MLRLASMLVLTVILAVVAAGSLTACSGSSAVNESLNQAAAPEPGQPIAEEAPFAGFPPIPLDGIEDGAGPKGVSWLYNVDPTTPFLSHRTLLCPLHPDCMQLIGLQDMPMTHVPPPPYYAYAFYQLPIGGNDAALEHLNLYGAVESADDKYYVAMANFDAMAWEWYGPANGDYTIDFSTVSYDFTGPAGNAYIAVVVPAFDWLHLWGIELDYADGSTPLWTAWGVAFDYLSPTGAAPTYAAGETVSLENTLTGDTYTATTATNGVWSVIVPDGEYEFSVTNNNHLFDPGAFMIIDNLPVILEMNTGQLIYHGSNPVYDGNVVPLPIITLNVF